MPLLLLGTTALSQSESSKVVLSADERAILELTNAARKKEKLPPLTVTPKLMAIARAHAKNMAKQDKMSHELDGKKPADRARAIGYDFARIGENVAYGEGDFGIPQIFEGWMKSEGHRMNILKSEFTEIGIGVADGTGEKRYYAQVLGRPQD
jgi:uncharacterized protein YkwD